MRKTLSAVIDMTATETTVAEVRPILVDPIAAAKILSMSDRSLADLTHPKGPIRCIRLGNNIRRYRVADLERWLRNNHNANTSRFPREASERKPNPIKRNKPGGEPGLLR